MILYRPVGQKELDLIVESGYKKFPPRLPEQPIFYPVLTQKYAEEIAERWNSKDRFSRYKGYVTQFEIDDSFISNYEGQQVGDTYHLEYWIPFDELESIMIINKKNQNLIGIEEFNLHDLLINSIIFQLDEKKIIFKIYNENSSLHLFTITFENVFEFLFSSIKKDSDPYDNIILGWEEIPNTYTKDFFLEEVKEKFILNGGIWNPDFFAIRILTVPMKEIKIICEKIIFEKNQI